MGVEPGLAAMTLRRRRKCQEAALRLAQCLNSSVDASSSAIIKTPLLISCRSQLGLEHDLPVYELRARGPGSLPHDARNCHQTGCREGLDIIEIVGDDVRHIWATVRRPR